MCLSSFLSCPKPYHGVLVPWEGAGSGVWTDPGLLPLGLGPELLPDAEVWVSVRYAVDAVGRWETQHAHDWTLDLTFWGYCKALCICFMCKGTFLCVLGFLSAITVSVLDKMGMKQLGLDGVIQEESRKVVRHR